MPGMISKAVLEDIRFRCDIVDVIDSYLTLPRKGAVIKALCPFHKEKTPSFTVNRQKQIFHCFGCGAGGDVFKFVMMHEHVDFPTAIRILAEKAGVTLEYDQEARPAGEKEELLAIHEEAALLYHKFLLKDLDAQAARDYLSSRDLHREVAEDFMIGYAPDQWTFTFDWARRKGYSTARLEQAGLVVRRTGEAETESLYDRFRGRIMFPIRNEQGRIVGFSGRTLVKDAKVAKYVNSPETPLFRKSHILYALDRARRDIVECREAIICEGQIDVIRCHQAGFKTAVAAQGTAFTEDHARMLRRYADGVVLVFDSDEAGRQAALKTNLIFLKAGLAVRIASLPPGEDPDSLILKRGRDAFAEALSKAVPAIDFQMGLLLAQENIRTEMGLMKVTRELLGTISQSPNAIQRDVLIQTVARRLGVAPSALQAELRPLMRNSAPRDPEPAPPAPSSHPPLELALVEHLAACPALAPLVETYLPRSLMTDALCLRLLALQLESALEGSDLLTLLTERDDDERSLSTFAARILSAPQKSGTDTSHEEAVQSLILSFWKGALQRKRSDLERGAEAATTEQDRDEMMAQASLLTTDLKKLQRWDSGLSVLPHYLDNPPV